MNEREKIIIKLENCMNLRNLSKQELAKEWKKSDAYVYRRFSQEVDFSLTDITDVVNILNLSKKEAIDIFFD